MVKVTEKELELPNFVKCGICGTHLTRNGMEIHLKRLHSQFTQRLKDKYYEMVESGEIPDTTYKKDYNELEKKALLKRLEQKYEKNTTKKLKT